MTELDPGDFATLPRDGIHDDGAPLSILIEKYTKAGVPLELPPGEYLFLTEPKWVDGTEIDGKESGWIRSASNFFFDASTLPFDRVRGVLRNCNFGCEGLYKAYFRMGEAVEIPSIIGTRGESAGFYYGDQAHPIPKGEPDLTRKMALNMEAARTLQKRYDAMLWDGEPTPRPLELPPYIEPRFPSGYDATRLVGELEAEIASLKVMHDKVASMHNDEVDRRARAEYEVLHLRHQLSSAQSEITRLTSQQNSAEQTKADFPAFNSANWNRP